MHFKFHNVRSRQKCAKFISRLFHTNVLWNIFLSWKNDKVLMVGYPRQIMFWSPSPGLATKWTGLEIHQKPWVGETTQTVSASVCPRLHNKGQHLGEATKIFLEYRILSIPVDKKVSVMTVWKLDSDEKSPLDVNLIVWGEAAMTHVWWPPFGSLFDFRKHNGDKAPEESWKLIQKTYPSKTLDPEHCESILNPVLFTPYQ